MAGTDPSTDLPRVSVLLIRANGMSMNVKYENDVVPLAVYESGFYSYPLLIHPACPYQHFSSLCDLLPVLTATWLLKQHKDSILARSIQSRPKEAQPC